MSLSNYREIVKLKASFYVAYQEKKHIYTIPSGYCALVVLSISTGGYSSANGLCGPNTAIRIYGSSSTGQNCELSGFIILEKIGGQLSLISGSTNGSSGSKAYITTLNYFYSVFSLNYETQYYSSSRAQLHFNKTYPGTIPYGNSGYDEQLDNYRPEFTPSSGYVSNSNKIRPYKKNKVGPKIFPHGTVIKTSDSGKYIILLAKHNKIYSDPRVKFISGNTTMSEASHSSRLIYKVPDNKVAKVFVNRLYFTQSNGASCTIAIRGIGGRRIPISAFTESYKDGNITPGMPLFEFKEDFSVLGDLVTVNLASVGYPQTTNGYLNYPSSGSAESRVLMPTMFSGVGMMSGETIQVESFKAKSYSGSTTSYKLDYDLLIIEEDIK